MTHQALISCIVGWSAMGLVLAPVALLKLFDPRPRP